MSISLALQQHVPGSAVRDARRWAYAGEDPAFELTGLERVPVADALDRAARELRDPYLDAIGELSRLNRSSEWWASHLAAKHPYPSLFARLCGVAAVLDLISDGTLVICATPAQLDVVRAITGTARGRGTWAGRLRWEAPRAGVALAWPALRALGEHGPDALRGAIAAADPRARFAMERTAGHRRRILSALGGQPLVPLRGKRTALLVTWLDGRCFSEEGEYRDPHLGPLGSMLTGRGWEVARLVKPLLHAPFAACARAMIAAGEPAALPDLYLSAADWRSSERRIKRTRFSIPSGIRVGPLPFASLAREYLREHMRAQVDAISHERLVARLAAAGVQPELIVFPWEGHAWEQVFVAAVRRHMPQTRTIGYDNLNFSRLALSLYPAELEVDIRPLPDRVVSNGRTFADALGASAFPSERIRVGCALRHEYLHTALPAAAAGDREQRAFVLAACSIDTAQSVELLRKAHRAFGERLLAKLHPASDERAIRASLPTAIRYADRPLSELLPDAQLMLYTYSVVPYEALAAGIPPVFVRSESRLDLDQLDPTPDVRWSARTPEELRAVAAEIEALPDPAAWRRRANEVVSAALAPVTPACIGAFVDE